MLALRNVSVELGTRTVVDSVDASVESGGWLGLIGPNGAGKSTLLRAVAGLVPHTGTVELNGGDRMGLDRRALARVVAFVPQEPLLPDEMRVRDYVLLGRTPHLGFRGEQASDLETSVAVLARLELSALAERQLRSLSGGERQRAVIARALAQEPALLLLDEPTSSLDLGHQQRTLELVDELRRERGLTVIAAMHDLTLVGQYADVLVLLDGGRVVAAGSPAEVLEASTIALHYGAEISLLQDPAVGVAVIPQRGGRPPS
jgi:iron complex transport system ATP-binding protein